MAELFLPGFPGRGNLYDVSDSCYADGCLGFACMAAGSVCRLPGEDDEKWKIEKENRKLCITAGNSV